MLTYQLLHDLRDGASSQAGTPRQVSAGNGLAGAYQLKDDIPVDDSCGLARREFQFSQINVPYAVLIRLSAISLEPSPLNMQ